MKGTSTQMRSAYREPVVAVNRYAPYAEWILEPRAKRRGRGGVLLPCDRSYALRTFPDKGTEGFAAFHARNELGWHHGFLVPCGGRLFLFSKKMGTIAMTKLSVLYGIQPSGKLKLGN